jgi:hypothetical protein
LSELAEAFFVDIDDDDRSLRRDTRSYLLEDIESSQAQLLQGRGIGDAQEQQRDQQP